MKKINNKGFTVYELIATIIATFLLSWLVLYVHKGITVNSRNDLRVTRIKNTQSELESYYSRNGHYPSLTDLNNVNFRNKELTNFDQSNLLDPLSKLSTQNLVLSSSPMNDMFAYEVTDSNGNSCEKDDMLCSKYNLTASYEGKVSNSKYYVRQNID
jgi:Tfp pilus assembly protein PilE